VLVGIEPLSAVVPPQAVRVHAGPASSPGEARDAQTGRDPNSSLGVEGHGAVSLGPVPLLPISKMIIPERAPGASTLSQPPRSSANGPKLPQPGAYYEKLPRGDARAFRHISKLCAGAHGESTAREDGSTRQHTGQKESFRPGVKLSEYL